MKSLARLLVLFGVLAAFAATGCGTAPTSGPSVTERVGTTIPKPP